MRPWTSLAAQGKAQSVSGCVYLDNMPSGVTLSDPISIARAIPGASRSITSLVACNTNTQVTAKGFDKHLLGQMCSLCLLIPTSGVTSLGAKPVPPVVRIRLSSSSSHHSNRVSWNTQTLAQFLSKEIHFLPARIKQRRRRQASAQIQTHLDFIDLIWNDLVGWYDSSEPAEGDSDPTGFYYHKLAAMLVKGCVQKGNSTEMDLKLAALAAQWSTLELQHHSQN